MGRPKKNATVNEEVKDMPIEEKKTGRRGRPKKKPEILPTELVKEIPQPALKVETLIEKEEEEVKQPAKRGRRKKTEIVAVEEKEEVKQPAKRGRKKKIETEVEPEKEITMIVQYKGQEIEEKEIIQRIEKAWREEGNTATIKTITMYVKPEDGKIYYLINGLSGSIDLF